MTESSCCGSASVTVHMCEDCKHLPSRHHVHCINSGGSASVTVHVCEDSKVVTFTA